jgi:hypothetical protein
VVSTGSSSSSTLEHSLSKHNPNMITSLQLGNFKAFGATQKFPIKPLTLLFGPNSAGKSSIIQGLLLFHEVERNSQFSLHSSSTFGESWTISRGNFDIKSSNLAGNLVDLGGFDSYVHCGRNNKNVSLGIDFDLKNPLLKEQLSLLEVGTHGDARPDQFEEGDLAKFLGKHSSIGVTLEVGRKVPKPTYFRPEYDKAKDGVFLVKRHVHGALDLQAVTVQKCEILLDGEWVVRFERITDLTMELAAVNRANKWVCENLVSDSLDLRKPTDAAWFEVLASLLPEHLRGKHLGWSHRLQQQAAPLARLCSVLRKVAAVACQGMDYLGGIRAIPPRYLGSSDDQDVNWSSTGADAWHWLLRSPDLLAQVNAWLGSPARLRVPFRLQIQRLVDAELVKRVTHSALREKRPHGKSISKAITKAVSEVMKTARRELKLVDQFTGALVSHRDVGLGISQILPVLVNAIGSEHRTFCIEQPEIHLHPALQAELGDVFIESALGGRRNVFLLETHSEHLILRILRRVRETTEKRLPQGATPVRPEDITVIFVEPTAKGSVVRHLPVTPDGDFGAPWPGGFFADRLADLP